LESLLSQVDSVEELLLLLLDSFSLSLRPSRFLQLLVFFVLLWFVESSSSLSSLYRAARVALWARFWSFVFSEFEDFHSLFSGGLKLLSSGGQGAQVTTLEPDYVQGNDSKLKYKFQMHTHAYEKTKKVYDSNRYRRTF
jgi:hypothetical protein